MPINNIARSTLCVECQGGRSASWDAERPPWVTPLSDVTSPITHFPARGALAG